MKKLLFLNACMNRERSRTCRLGRELVALLRQSGDYETTLLILEDESIPPLTSKTLNERTEMVKNQDFANPMFAYAKQFREADCIVIAAPYWDCGFPSVLKTYIEAISVPGLTYRYGEDGQLQGLCRAEKLYYVTTRGGFIDDDSDLGYKTIVGIGRYCGIKDIRCISVAGLDIPVTDVESALNRAVAELPDRL